MNSISDKSNKQHRKAGRGPVKDGLATDTDMVIVSSTVVEAAHDIGHGGSSMKIRQGRERRKPVSDRVQRLSYADSGDHGDQLILLANTKSLCRDRERQSKITVFRHCRCSVLSSASPIGFRRFSRGSGSWRRGVSAPLSARRVSTATARCSEVLACARKSVETHCSTPVYDGLGDLPWVFKACQYIVQAGAGKTRRQPVVAVFWS